jgi:cyclase
VTTEAPTSRTGSIVMEQVTPNVYTNTRLRGCNPSFVTTADGVVVIDTPQLPTKAVAMRREAESHGPIRYLINTEHHVDHIFGNYYFRGAGTVVNHRELYERFMVVCPELDPFAYAYQSIPGDDPKGTDLDEPEAVALWPDRDEYYLDPNAGRIVFTGDLTLRVGDHTFELLHTPGHTPGQLAVHVPEERVVFTGDTIFSGCQTWLMTSDVDQWLAALDRIGTLDVDWIVPGHGPVVAKAYLDVQRAHLLAWKAAVAMAIARGWSRDETIARVSFKDDFGPVDIGQGYMLDYIQSRNAAALYDKLTGSAPRLTAPDGTPAGTGSAR